MIKLINILKEINEGKQVGNLYHFTYLTSIPDILKSQYLRPNLENQISTSRRPDMEINTEYFDKLEDQPIARMMFNGDKISNNYKIAPLNFEDEENLGEEQIIVNGKNFYFLPYLKRIDIFIKKKQSKSLTSKILILLDSMNIPYKVYEGTPSSNIPYKQPKEGEPSNIKYTPTKKTTQISNIKYVYPYSSFTTINFTNNPNTYLPNQLSDEISKTKHPLIFYNDWVLTPDFPGYYVSSTEKTSLNTITAERNLVGITYNFNDPITKKILQSIEFRTWKELGIEEKIKNIKKELSDKGWKGYLENKGLLMLPKNIADEYLIPKKIIPSNFLKQNI